jgi:PAS domain S-box-containing protein
VLLLYTESRLLPAIVATDHALRSRIEAGWPGPVFFYTEYLDTSLFFGDVPQEELGDLLRRKYALRPLDVVVAAGSRALRIAIQNRGELFPGVPVVFMSAAPNLTGDLKLDDDVTGTWMTLSWAGTLDAALRLQPDTRKVVVVSGVSLPDRTWLGIARDQLAAHAGALDVTYLTDHSIEDVLVRVANLPERTIVLAGSFLRDARGRDLIGAEAVRRIASASKVPVYGISETFIGHGIVGGHVASFEAHGTIAGEMVLRVLRGERPPPTDAGTNVFMFDGRQLKRWGLDERRLPPGSVVRFRQPSAWDLYRPYIVGGGVLIALQSLLIAVLLLQRVERRRAEKALAERLRFETLLSELSATFITLPVREVDREIDGMLRRMTEELELDRASLAELDERRRVMRVTHAAVRAGIDAVPPEIEQKAFPWMGSRLLDGQVVRVPRLDVLPAAADTDRESLVALGTRSTVAVPLVVGGTVVGALAFSTIRAEREWSDELVGRLQLLAEVFANALARRRAERAVRESEDRFRLLADSAPLMVWMSGPDSGRTYFNRGWLDITGRLLTEELGEGWTASVHPGEREAIRESVREALAERRPFTIDYRLRRWDGEYRWVLDHGLPRVSDDGRFAGYIGSAIDITELKAAQEALLESDALRSAIFGSLYGQVVAIDRDGVIIAVNQSWMRSATEAGGDPARLSVGANYLEACRQAAARGDADSRRALDAITGVLQGGGQAHFEYTSNPPEGERSYEVTVEAFRRPEGGAVISHVDVTRRRQAEDEVRRQREELAHALRVTTLGELAASLAHEINQPLAAIVTNAQATRRLLDSDRAKRADMTEALADIAEDAKRASLIIRRLRALFRKEQAERKAVAIGELVEDVVSLMRRDLERRRITVEVGLGAGLPRVQGDPVQLQQVLLNVLVNACEAIALTEDGPREIGIETVLRGGHHVEIVIRDTGIGVKEAELTRIFERFVSTKAEGLGMGLSISRSIVEAHGGRIRATANAPRGLTVHVELPGEGGEERP